MTKKKKQQNTGFLSNQNPGIFRLVNVIDCGLQDYSGEAFPDSEKTLKNQRLVNKCSQQEETLDFPHKMEKYKKVQEEA